jgi:hypothetical protein
MIIDSENYSDLDPLKSNDWTIYLTTLDDNLDLQLTQLLQNFYDQLKKTISINQVLGSLIQHATDTVGQNDDYKLSLERLTNPIVKTTTHRTLRSFMKPVVQKAASTIKQLNAISAEAPLKKNSLDDIMNVSVVFILCLNLTISLILSFSFYFQTQLAIKMKYL